MVINMLRIKNDSTVLDFSHFKGINQNFVIASISEATQSRASLKFCTGLLHFVRNDDRFSSFFKNGQTPVLGSLSYNPGAGESAAAAPGCSSGLPSRRDLG